MLVTEFYLIERLNGQKEVDAGGSFWVGTIMVAVVISAMRSK